MKRFGVALALMLVGALLAVGVCLTLLLRGGISAKVEPTRAEAAIAHRLRRIGIPDEARALRNPMPVSQETIAAGRAHFADHCAVCHANDGSGQTEMGRNLYPRSPDLRKAATQQSSDGELFYIIENGVRLTGMPAWGDGSDESRRASWQLVDFIRELPRQTAGKKLEMERLNPKSPEEWREMQEDQEFLQGKETPDHENPHHH